MKLASVVCRVIEDDGMEHLHNVDPALFLDILSAATEGQDPQPQADDLAALQAELNAARKNPAPLTEGPSLVAAPKNIAGMIVLPRAAVEPLFGAKTRGELIEKVDELLSQFNARLAKEGEGL